MGMQQTPRRQRSPWARYGPIIAVVVIIAIIGIVIAVNHGSSNNSTKANVNSNTPASSPVASGTNGIPLFYNDAKSQGVADKYKWHNCDTTTGYTAIPTLNPAPCVEEFDGNNGGATSTGVTADTIRIGYYIPKQDPTLDGVLAQAGAYDPPAEVAQAYQDYVKIYAGTYQLWGRKIQLVRLNGTTTGNDEVSAKADADQAAAEHVFAVMGGPPQAKAFSEELAQKKVLCVGQCIIAQPQKYYEDNEPYLWPVGPSPEQASTMTATFIKNQMIGKPAQWAGPAINGKQRTYNMLTYDTPDGEYKSSWDDLKNKLQGIGAKVVGHTDYYLNVATMQSDARTIATKLKQENATTIVFTGDPVFPIFLTQEMTKENYFPEWVMSGTVLADTNVFARKFDQQQWQHAFGLQLLHTAIPNVKQDAWTVHQWWFNGAPPPDPNAFALTHLDVQLLFAGLQLAGPNLTPQAFKNGIDAAPPIVDPSKPTVRSITTYGNHNIWSADDPSGLDSAGIFYWDPNVTGPDETGTMGKGMYRMLDGGVRYLSEKANNWPTSPVPLFDPANTVTQYAPNDVPADLLPKQQPLPPGHAT